jgi:hypothetical protein
MRTNRLGFSLHAHHPVDCDCGVFCRRRPLAVHLVQLVLQVFTLRKQSLFVAATSARASNRTRKHNNNRPVWPHLRLPLALAKPALHAQVGSNRQPRARTPVTQHTVCSERGDGCLEHLFARHTLQPTQTRVGVRSGHLPSRTSSRSARNLATSDSSVAAWDVPVFMLACSCHTG